MIEEQAMLRIDRNVLPGLPRPVFEINAQKVGNGVRLTVMVAAGNNMTYTDVEATDADTFEQSVQRWLLERPYFESDDLRWSVAAAEVAKRIGTWLKEASVHILTTFVQAP